MTCIIIRYKSRKLPIAGLDLARTSVGTCSGNGLLFIGTPRRCPEQEQSKTQPKGSQNEEKTR